MVAILDLAKMAAPTSAGFGALKKIIYYNLIYTYAKFHNYKQICTINP